MIEIIKNRHQYLGCLGTRSPRYQLSCNFFDRAVFVHLQHNVIHRIKIKQFARAIPKHRFICRSDQIFFPQPYKILLDFSFNRRHFEWFRFRKQILALAKYPRIFWLYAVHRDIASEV